MKRTQSSIRINLPKARAAFCLTLCAVLLSFSDSKSDAGITYGGAGFIQVGGIFQSADTVNQKLNGLGLYSSGAQLSFRYEAEKLQINAGLGVVNGNFIDGKIGGYAPAMISPYVVDASLTYSLVKRDGAQVFLRAGDFAYNYNPDVKNLGLYLLRGPLYPGVLISGFENKYVVPVANMLGLQFHHAFGNFEGDLIFKSDADFYPFFDISPAYVASYRMGALRLGAGINLYHILPMDDSLTSSRSWFYVDSTRHNADTANKLDTSYISFKGIKLMADASLDFKPLLGGLEMLGPEDLKLYGEVALLGLDRDKAHNALYGDLQHRMPVMVGFNFPMFKLLDHLSLEVEWYGAKFADDLRGFRYTAASHPTPIPMNPLDPYGNPQPDVPSNPPPFNYKRDNWKWSLHASRVFAGHMKVTGQVADDHFRPGIYKGDSDNSPPGSEAVTITPKDWYGMLQVAYFF